MATPSLPLQTATVMPASEWFPLLPENQCDRRGQGPARRSVTPATSVDRVRGRIRQAGLSIGHLARRSARVPVQPMSHPLVNLLGFPRIEEAI
jgi:hypothetical protein